MGDLSREHPPLDFRKVAGRDENEGFRFIVIEWIDGESLEQFLERLGRLTWDDFFERVGRKILPALVFATERDIAHRDLSTSNVLVAANDAIKIIDFGQARIDADAQIRHVETEPLGRIRRTS